MQEEVQRQPTSVEKRRARSLELYLEHIRELGPCTSVERFLQNYARTGTTAAYAGYLLTYFRWLRDSKGISLSPDGLIRDNLERVFKSDPTDTVTKRRHTDYLSDWVNDYLVKKGTPESTRAQVASIVRRYYESNDSNLFGSFRVASQPATPPPPPLNPDDIRQVLKALPLAHRFPLVCVWQSGAEINRILALTWSAFNDEYPLKLQWYGRKKHKKSYHSYLGKDGILLSKLWREKWANLQGRTPGPNDLVFLGKGGPMDPGNINNVFKSTAMSLYRQHLIKNGNPASWHSHSLRHSFETEGTHAKVPKELRGFFEGHVSDISWTYNHADQIHERDLAEEYLKLEPFVSLDPDRTALENEFEEREKSLVRRLEAAEALLSALRREFPESQKAQPEAGR